TVAWLQSFGVKFDAMPTYFMTAAAPRIMPVGGGLALIEGLRARALKEGVQILYETTATQLSKEAHGYELRANGRGGDLVSLSAPAVMIASGGFEGSQEMMTQYMGPTAKYIRPVARGGYYNKGEGIRLALGLGAAAAGDFASFHAEPIDPRSKLP